MSNPSAKLEGKIALITGGGSGIGLATAQRFVAEGARVFITDLRQTELDAAVAKIGTGATGVQGDVSNLADLDRLYATIKEQAGRLDVVFANAGMSESAPLGEITEEHYEKVFNINAKGLLFTVQKALPLLGENSSVILNSSVVGSKGTPEKSVYGATKAAMRGFIRTWVLDLKGRGIRINIISPGPIRTPAFESLATPDFEQQMIAAVPMGRIGESDEVAKVVVFLASDDSSYVNGVELFVDGGMAQV